MDFPSFSASPRPGVSGARRPGFPGLPHLRVHSSVSTQRSALSTQHSDLSAQHSTTPAVRPLDSVAEYRRCQEIQRLTWGITEEGYLMPISLLAAAHRYGGLVLGAFLGDELVGFSFAFLARVGDQPGLYSQLTAVLPEHQGRGMGYLLKQSQRQAARARDLALIVWAFDPLQAGNAAFNLAKLGARCRRYEVNMYGARSDALNAGIETDRLIAEWRVDDPDPARRQPAEATGERLFTLHPDGAWSRPEPAGRARGPRLELDIPPAIQELKRERPDLAPLWQEQVRQAFLDTLADGYAATGFGSSDDGARCWYVLERE